MLEPGLRRYPARLPGHREDHLEVQGLLGPDHVYRPVRAELVHPVADRGQVGRGVVVAAVALADDERQRPALAAGEARGERAQRALAHDRDAPLLELAHGVREHVVVEALAADVLVREAHPEPGVHLVQVPAGDVDQALPDGHRVRVPGLQPDQPAPGALGERRVGVELAPGRLVERVRVGGQQPRLGRVHAHVEQVLDQHAERGAPVADVVVPDHPVPGELQDARDGVADDGGAQVPDVHLLGHVRRGVFDHHRLRAGHRREPEPGVVQHQRGLGGDPVIAQREVDEAGTADLGLGAHVGDVQPGHRTDHHGQWRGQPRIRWRRQGAADGDQIAVVRALRVGHEAYGGPALGRKEGRVHVGHLVLDDVAEDPLQRGQLEHLDVVVGDLAAHLDIDLLGDLAGQGREDPTQLLGERDARAYVLGDHTALDVDRVGHQLTGQREAHRPGHGHAGLLLRLVGGGTEVGGGDDVLELEER